MYSCSEASARAKRTVVFAVVLLVATPATAQSVRLKNITSCNGADQNSLDPRIKGCTALIEAGNEPPRIVAIAYNNRGNARTARGAFDQAIEDYNQAIKINPNYAKAFNNRGAAFEKKGQYERAIRDFDEAIKIEPQYAKAYVNRAEVYLNQGSYGRAIQDYDQAIQIQPSSVALSGRCRTRAIMGEAQAALADCNEAIRLAPTLAISFDSRGLTYLKLSQWDLAISDYSTALRLDPKLASSYYGRGVAHLKNGLTDRAGADIAAARSVAANIDQEFARYGAK